MTFDELRQADYKFPTVALFYGASCAPCERLKPQLREVCKSMGARLEEFNTANEMEAVRTLGLRSVPAVVVVHRGGIVQTAFSGIPANIRKSLVEAGVLDQ
jgi:thioredoxin-like negative regulator of GroEL